jgi:hypothetical protein
MCLVILLLLLSSCASRAAVRENSPYAYLTGNSKYFLLPPNEIDKPMDMAQYVSAYYNGKDYFFSSWVKADEAGMEMILFNELGAGMGELSYRNGSVNFSSPIFPKALRGEYIVADFQLCFYNPISLRDALKKCGLVLETDESTRRVIKGKTIIIEIEKTHDAVRLVNHPRGYAYTLEGVFE